MAQVAKIDVAKAVKMGEKLPPVADLKMQMDVVPAKDLTYANPQAWIFHGETAEFVGQGDPTVYGTYDVTKLDKGLMYEVDFYVTMNNHQVTSPVTLTLELPNGTKQEKTEIITLDPLVWKAVSVGKFLNMFPTGDIKFKFSGVTGDTWKGLLLQYVLITPSFN
ncbi:hypothetical protein ACET3Z_003539 [Daucus carota]